MTEIPTLKTLKDSYSKGALPKQDFIQKALNIHRQLYDYVESMKDTDVNEINITSKGISFVMQDEGIQLFIPPEEARVVPLEIMNFGSYEPGETRVIDLLSSGSQQILDIGANIGWYAIRFAKREPQSKIYAFEPMPISYSYLQKNVAINGVGSSVTGFNLGLSEDCGSVDFYITPTSGVNASLLNVANAADAQKIIGLTLSLDRWCENYQVRPDFIKCDVEGAELLVFRGGKETLIRDKPVIFTELLRKWTKPFGYHPNDMLAYFSELGYLCYAVGKNRVYKIEKVTDETIETNYTFIHAETHKQAIAVLENLKL